MKWLDDKMVKRKKGDPVNDLTSNVKLVVKFLSYSTFAVSH